MAMRTTGGAMLNEFPGYIFNELRMKIGNDFFGASGKSC